MNIVNHNCADGLSVKLDRYLSLLAQEPTNQRLYRECVELASQLKRFEVLAELTGARLRREPTDCNAMFQHASALIGLRDYRAALAVLAPLAAQEVNLAVHLNSGLCHYCLGEYDLAASYLELCFSNGSRETGLLRLLVSSYHHVGRIEEAVAIAEATGSVADACAQLAGIYALLYLDAEDVLRASRWAKTALDLDPQSLDGRVTQATLLTARMQAARATQMFQSVLADAPHTARAWIGLGTLSLLARDLETAKQQLTRGVELMPRHVGSWDVLACVHLVSGDLESAEAALQQAMKLDRTFAETHGGLAMLAAIRGQTAHAQQLIEVARRLDPESVLARFAQAMLSGSAGDAPNAHAIVRHIAEQIGDRDHSALAQLLTKVATQSAST